MERDPLVRKRGFSFHGVIKLSKYKLFIIKHWEKLSIYDKITESDKAQLYIKKEEKVELQ